MATPHRRLREIRRSHEQLIIDAVREAQSLTRAEIRARTQLSRSTVADIVASLIDDGLLIENEPAPSDTPTRGRPVRPISLNIDNTRILGIEMARRHTIVAAADLTGRIVARRTVAAPSPFDLAASQREAIATARILLGDSPSRIAGIAIGLPSRVPARLPGGPTALSDTFLDEFGVTPIVENNVRLVALAETQWGAGTGLSDVAYLHLDSGVGGGLVLSGRLVFGARGGGAEFGHICVDANGPSCTCGGVGCLERYTSIDALLSTTGEDTIDTLIAHADRHREALQDAAGRAGVALAGVLAITDVRRLIIGGRVAAIPGLLEMIAREIVRTGGKDAVADVSVAPARIGKYASVKGAIALALRSSSLISAGH